MGWRTLGIAIALTGLVQSAGAQPGPGEWPFDPAFLPHRGRIGVRVQAMTPELREYFAVPTDRGVLVNAVESGGPAERAGVEVGDVVVGAGADPVATPYDLVRAVARVPAGGKLALEMVRKGKGRTAEVAPDGDPAPWVDPEAWEGWLDRGVHRGRRELLRRLDELERRLQELERELREAPPQKTSHETESSL